MKIQEYTCETAPQSLEFTDEAIRLAEELGASGQAQFYKPGESPVPYRKMSKVEYAVYKCCLPVREKIKDFNAGPIPLRVLQIASHASTVLEGTLIIWHAGVGKDDPLLTMRQGSEYNGEYYLLARWADELEEFSVLLDRAVQEMTATCQAKLAECKAQIEGYERSLAVTIKSRLLAGKTDEPGFHWY